MKIFTLFLAFAAVGCSLPQPNAPIPIEAKKVEPKVEEPKTEEPQDSRVMRPKDDNPSRIYQLRDLETAKVKIGKNVLTLWLMNNNSKREEGMMFLQDKDVKADQGMLFVFLAAEEQGFWMHNTFIPLDVAYIGADKKILNVAVLKALDETSVKSKGKAQFVLEMKKGAFERLGIKPGMTVEIPADVKAWD